MAVSYPSNVVTVLDVPEVKNFTANFRYNFFVTDEKNNDAGDSRLYGSSNLESQYSLQKRIPRWIEFSFSSVDVKTNLIFDDEFILDIGDPKNVKNIIFSNLDKIQGEIDVTNGGYSILGLRDQEIEYKTDKFLMSSLEARSRSTQHNEYANYEKDWIYTPAASADFLKKFTGEYISGKWISRMIGKLENRSVRHHDTLTGASKNYVPNYVNDLKSISTYSQINEKFIQDILSRSVADPASPYMNEFSYKTKNVSELQSSARQNKNPDVLSEEDYFPNIVPISINKVDPDKFSSAVKIIGYIIDKWEIQPNKVEKECEPIIVVGSESRVAIDTKVKYSGYYAYSIRAIALAQFQSIDEETSQIYAISGLISSRPSQKIQVKCLETKSPPPPTDVDFVWDYGENKLMIMWSFPVTSQRDIKRFQVFRRFSILEPFELQIEYDFDDSEVPDVRHEKPKKSQVVPLQNPLTTYWDEEFTKRTVAIYSLCSIDAHDFSSNYSVQYIVWFDEIKNRLMKKLISPAGAPKPYPNFYLIETQDIPVQSVSLTSDSIKDSGHTSCKIFFDPEYLSVKGRDSDLNVLTTLQDGGSYKVQFINVDRQKSQILNIELNDLRDKK